MTPNLLTSSAVLAEVKLGIKDSKGIKNMKFITIVVMTANMTMNLG